MTHAVTVSPPAAPPDCAVSVPGSKSITNRALVAAFLAAGTSELTNVLAADDTEAMLDAVAALGATVDVDGTTVRVTGVAGVPHPGPRTVTARQAGTVARFLPPVLALGHGPYRLDAAPAMRARPMAPLFEALRSLGAAVTEEGEPGHLPATIIGAGVPGGTVRVRGDVSSQFLSGLLLAAPCMRDGLRVEATTDIVSRPYLDLTLDVLAAFGAAGRWQGARAIAVDPGGYRATRFQVEPDATAASYFFAAAAITGGRVTVPGLGRRSRQGDLAFVDVLARMGARVEVGDDATTVTGTGVLHGVEVDMGAISDTAQTLAAIAPFADGPTRVEGIGFIRRKETDRVAAVVTELRRCGVDAVEEADGWSIRPGAPTAAEIRTYADHRMAMSFALLGLRVPGVTILDPDCVGKTFPGYWDALRAIGARVASDARCE